MKLWVKHFVWIIGMLLLLIVSYHFEHHANITDQHTFRIAPEVWIGTAISFVLGVYLSLLFINNFRFQINKSLLVCVFIPCTIIGLYVPIAVTFPLPFPAWVSSLNTNEFPMVLSGMSLILSLFTGIKTKWYT